MPLIEGDRLWIELEQLGCFFVKVVQDVGVVHREAVIILIGWLAFFLLKDSSSCLANYFHRYLPLLFGFLVIEDVSQ